MELNLETIISLSESAIKNYLQRRCRYLIFTSMVSGVFMIYLYLIFASMVLYLFMIYTSICV